MVIIFTLMANCTDDDRSVVHYQVHVEGQNQKVALNLLAQQD
jgi:hypothetical protein